MGTWNGFTTDLLDGARLHTAKMDVQFMFDWNFAASSDCQNNPVDISHTVRGSHDCKKLTTTRTAQNYSTTQMAVNSFAAQINSGNFPHLLAALKTDNPYAYSDPNGVIDNLKTWGSPKQAAYYAKNATGGTTGTGGPNPTAMHKGWADLQHSVNKQLPAALNESRRSRHAALRELSRARKVRG